MNQGSANHQDPPKSNDLRANPSADSSPCTPSADVSSTLPVEPPADSPDSPVAVYSILSKIPCLQNQGFMEAVNARLQKKTLVKNWVKIVGPKLAEHTIPLMQDQKLIVIVNEPRWMAALQQIKGILSKKVNEFLKSSHPLELEIRLGKISSFARIHSSSAIEDKKITSEQAVKIENLLGSIKHNEKLKQTLKNVLVRHCNHNQNFLEKN